MLCSNCATVLNPKSAWILHLEEEVNDAWLKKTVKFFKKFSKIDFEIYKNSNNEITFVELQGSKWKETSGRYATIINVDHLRLSKPQSDYDVNIFLLSCSFFYFYGKEEFENEYKKFNIDTTKYE